MSLYVPKHFSISERAAIDRLLREHPFALLLTPEPGGGEPAISHLPLLHVPDEGPHGTLLGHFARANPHGQAAAARESVAVFQGPHAYVSPSWYADPAAGVPTWNYAAVHASGTLEFCADRAEAQSIMDALIARFEGGRPAPWTLGLPERQHAAMMGAIVTFRLRIRTLTAKFKLSQNRSADDRRRVIAALAAEDHPEAVATAAWMQTHAAPPDAA